MNPKKILIPEVKPRSKKGVRGTKVHLTPQRALPLGINPRQRSEALGLLMIGFSAFSISLFTYLEHSHVSKSLLLLTAYFGFGIYIIPAIVGLLGLQRFLDREGENWTMRLLGVLGVLVFGLGLLGAEGGKFGATISIWLCRMTGPVPAKILLFFSTLASLIFALNILYKDILLFLAAFIRLGVVLTKWLAEGAISLVALAIEASKHTAAFFHHVSLYMYETFFPHEPVTALAGNLIPYREVGENAGTENLEVLPSPPAPLATTQIQSLNPFPGERHTISRKPPPDNKEEKNEGPLKHPFDPSSATVISDVSGVVFVTENPVAGFLCQEPMATHRIPEKTPVPAEVHPDNSRKEGDSTSVVLSGAIDLEETVFPKELPVIEPLVEIPPESPAAIPSSVKEEEDTDTPFLLDSHPIDRDLKTLEPETGHVETKFSKEAELPPLDLLIVPPARERVVDSNLTERSAKLLKTLEEFGIQAQITEIVEGPVISRFEIKPGPGVKTAKITSLETNLAMNLEAVSIRIEAPIPGKHAIGIEIPNLHPQPVFFYDLIKNESFKTPNTLMNLGLGVTISGRPVFADLSEMPHLLIAGSTGSGKSVCVNTIIASILFQARPDQVKMVMIDPKMVELSSYNGIPHLISPVITDPKKASAALLWGVEEMERRYKLMADCGVRKISSYNEELPRLRREVDPNLEPMPFIVIIIDELADLMMTASAEVETTICRLAQMARAVGMHLVIATQRPSVDVLTGIIKANLPSRIAFSVASQIDSRTILDAKGAESLLGKGDMLFVPKGLNKPLRLQGAYISDRELNSLTEWVKTQGTPEYIDIAPTKSDDDSSDTEEFEDEEGDGDSHLLKTIEDYLQTQEKTSTSMLQRKFKIGYNRAARIMDLIEEKGLVSPADGSNKRRVTGKRSASQA